MARPPKPKTPEQKDDAEQKAQARHEGRIALLQSTVDDLCERIADGDRSLVVRTIRAKSVDNRVVNAAFDAVQSALDDARKRFDAARSGDGDEEPKRRVNLAEI